MNNTLVRMFKISKGTFRFLWSLFSFITGQVNANSEGIQLPGGIRVEMSGRDISTAAAKQWYDHAVALFKGQKASAEVEAAEREAESFLLDARDLSKEERSSEGFKKKFLRIKQQLEAARQAFKAAKKQGSYQIGKLPKIWLRNARKHEKKAEEGKKSRLLGSIELVLSMNGIDVVVPILIKEGAVPMKDGRLYGVFPLLFGYISKKETWVESLKFQAWDCGFTQNGAIKAIALYYWVRETGYTGHLTHFTGYCKDCKFLQYQENAGEEKGWSTRYWCSKEGRFIDEVEVGIVNKTIDFTTERDILGKYRRQGGHQQMTPGGAEDLVTDGRDSIITRWKSKTNLGKFVKSALYNTCDLYSGKYEGLDLTPIEFALRKRQGEGYGIQYAIDPTITGTTSLMVPVSEEKSEEIIVTYK